MKINANVAFCVALLNSNGLRSGRFKSTKWNKTNCHHDQRPGLSMADTARHQCWLSQSSGQGQDGTYADATRASNAIITALTAGGVPEGCDREQ